MPREKKVKPSESKKGSVREIVHNGIAKGLSISKIQVEVLKGAMGMSEEDAATVVRAIQSARTVISGERRVQRAVDEAMGTKKEEPKAEKPEA